MGTLGIDPDCHTEAHREAELPPKTTYRIVAAGHIDWLWGTPAAVSGRDIRIETEMQDSWAS